MLRRSFRFQSELAAFLDAVLVCAMLVAALVTHKVLGWMFPRVFASFDMFKSYEHRAQVFCDTVRALADDAMGGAA